MLINKADLSWIIYGNLTIKQESEAVDFVRVIQLSFDDMICVG